MVSLVVPRKETWPKSLLRVMPVGQPGDDLCRDHGFADVLPPLSAETDDQAEDQGDADVFVFPGRRDRAGAYEVYPQGR